MIDISDQDTVLKKRSVLIAGHRTSVSIESVFWDILKDVVEERGISINQLVTEIDEARIGNLSSAIRVYTLRYLQSLAPSELK